MKVGRLKDNASNQKCLLPEIVVVWSKNAITDSNTDVEIIGLSINITNEVDNNDSTCKIDINSLKISGTREVGSPVTFTIDSSNSCSDTANYKFSYHEGYGSEAYDGLHWSSLTSSEYQSENNATFTFDSAGKYIVVIWAKNLTSDSNIGVEMIGVSVDIDNQGEEPYFPF